MMTITHPKLFPHFMKGQVVRSVGLTILVAAGGWLVAAAVHGAELRAGAATVSVTPDRPVALWGQMNTRISTGVASPVTATVLLLESVAGERSLGTTTFVACDVVAIPDEALAAIRTKVATRIPDFPVERIVASATNQFELNTDFGVAMKARSPALQTFVVQLAGPGTYLPSARAARGGGYSAIAESNEVGAEAGRVLVDHTVTRLSELFPAPVAAPASGQ